MQTAAQKCAGRVCRVRAGDWSFGHASMIVHNSGQYSGNIAASVFCTISTGGAAVDASADGWDAWDMAGEDLKSFGE